MSSTTSWRYRASRDASKASHEVPDASPDVDKLDGHIEQLAKRLSRAAAPSIQELYHQYQHQAGAMIDRVVPYEETPHHEKRADVLVADSHHELEGDGLVLVVHVLFDLDSLRLQKTAVCSGFVVNAGVSDRSQGDVIVTCAHTLEEIFRGLKHAPGDTTARSSSFSFVIPATGPPRPVTGLLSSVPRSDAIALESHATNASSKRLRSLPLTPFPVYPGTSILTHLFGSPDPPPIHRSIARTRTAPRTIDTNQLERPTPWISVHAWRRWGVGQMLGYRSYTGLEVEAGVSNVLPHILTSVLPTAGSSGGPLVNAETGCVVGMISGRRMDNRVQGERGWGCSAETIFEMFSLPGFTPTQK